MSSDLDVVERLRTDPAPAMHVALADVLAEGRRRHSRRIGRRVAVGGAAAVAAAVAVAVTLQLSGPARTAPPVSTPSGSTIGSYVWRPQQTELSGAATIEVSGVSYAVRVGGGVMTVKVTGDVASSPPLSAALLTNGDAWREAPGASGRRVLVGVVPGKAVNLVYEPRAGGSMAAHSVATRGAGDLTAFVISFADAQGAGGIAKDVGWLTPRGGLPSWILGDGEGSTAMALDFDGEVPALLPPYDVTVTGPPSTTTAPRKPVTVSIAIGDIRLGARLTASVDAGAGVSGAGGLQTQLAGADPETAVGYDTIALADGRSLVWGMLPQGVASVRPTVEGGVRVGTPVLYDLGAMPYTAFAVLVAGPPPSVLGLQVELAGRPGGLTLTR